MLSRIQDWDNRMLDRISKLRTKRLNKIMVGATITIPAVLKSDIQQKSLMSQKTMCRFSFLRKSGVINGSIFLMHFLF